MARFKQEGRMAEEGAAQGSTYALAGSSGSVDDEEKVEA
jgi:hypothetical protein